MASGLLPQSPAEWPPAACCPSPRQS